MEFRQCHIMGVRILLFIISDICQLLCGHDDVLSNRYRVFTQTLCLYGTCRDSFDVVCSPIVCLGLPSASQKQE